MSSTDGKIDPASAAVARFEHRAILESLPEIEALAPGLYEMKILNPTGDPEYAVRGA